MNYEISNALYERLLDEIGLSFEIDLLHGIIFPVVSFIGFLFNLINILILRDACFNTVFYKYLKIYCINSLIINIFSSFVFISHARHFSKLSNSYVSIAYFCYIFIPIVNTYYFYGTVSFFIFQLSFILTSFLAVYRPSADPTLKVVFSPNKWCDKVPQK